jgi:proline iminopeptidase
MKARKKPASGFAPQPRKKGELYAKADAPNFEGMLTVPGGHKLYVAEYGNPSGLPVIYCHGGPGDGTNPNNPRNFDPKKYRVILFDQRGCGKSVPFGKRENNTTKDLVADMERIRKHLGIESWVVFGGSWGSTLALAYAQKHTQRVKGLVLWGIFLGTKEELDWSHHGGSSFFFPDYYREFVEFIPKRERGDMLKAYEKRLNSKHWNVRKAAAKRFSALTLAGLNMTLDRKWVKDASESSFAEAISRMEVHYFRNKCFLTKEQLVRGARKLKGVPGVIVHGKYDMVSPVAAAYKLHDAWPEAKLVIVEDASHSPSAPGMTRALIEATDDFASRLTK